jgi:hypothetical protein
MPFQSGEGGELAKSVLIVIDDGDFHCNILRE